MNTSASKICNYLNHTEIISHLKKSALTFMLPTMFDCIDKTMNDRDEVSR